VRKSGDINAPPKSEVRGADTTLNERDVTPEGPRGQVRAAHEAGHMIGLTDEALDGGVRKPGEVVTHSKLVTQEPEFSGKPVVAGDDDRIMSDGTKILPEHGITSLGCLRAATKPALEDKDWGYTKRSLTPYPRDAKRLMPDEPEAAPRSPQEVPPKRVFP
jgi:hypothetical protein